MHYLKMLDPDPPKMNPDPTHTHTAFFSLVSVLEAQDPVRLFVGNLDPSVHNDQLKALFNMGALVGKAIGAKVGQSLFVYF